MPRVEEDVLRPAGRLAAHGLALDSLDHRKSHDVRIELLRRTEVGGCDCYVMDHGDLSSRDDAFVASGHQSIIDGFIALESISNDVRSHLAIRVLKVLDF